MDGEELYAILSRIEGAISGLDASYKHLTKDMATVCEWKTEASNDIQKAKDHMEQQKNYEDRIRNLEKTALDYEKEKKVIEADRIKQDENEKWRNRQQAFITVTNIIILGLVALGRIIDWDVLLRGP